jgi:hypothetical protein
VLDIARLEADVAEAPREQMPDLIGLLARLQARAQLRMLQPAEEEGVWVGASVVAPLLRIPRRTLYDRAPRLAWARRKATGNGWEFELSAARKAARREAA